MQRCSGTGVVLRFKLPGCCACDYNSNARGLQHSKPLVRHGRQGRRHVGQIRRLMARTCAPDTAHGRCHPYIPARQCASATRGSGGPVDAAWRRRPGTGWHAEQASLPVHLMASSSDNAASVARTTHRSLRGHSVLGGNTPPSQCASTRRIHPVAGWAQSARSPEGLGWGLVWDLHAKVVCCAIIIIITQDYTTDKAIGPGEL
jgi:hypothetical protein